MKITQRIKNAALAFGTTKNAMGEDISLSRKFLKNGGQRPLVQEWSQTVMTDLDFYTGYGFAAIKRVSNITSGVAQENLVTEAVQAVMDAAKKKNETVVHPYLALINSSLDFSNHKFWYEIATYLQLKGVYYLMVIRAVDEDEGRVGKAQGFKLLNPFDVKRIINKDTGEIGGYVEYRRGMYREIPEEMIIEVRTLNPVDRDEPYSAASAAKDSQFTLKQSGDFTRHAIQKNINSPGIVSIGDNDLMVDEEQFTNFKARIMGHAKGEPIFAEGNSLKYDAMQIDLDKTALKDVNEINRETIFSVLGVSKTLLGIEQSGTTRDTSKTQSDLAISGTAMPLLQLIVDALNLDYKRRYQNDYKSFGYEIVITNPLGSDKEVEIKEIEIKGSNFELYEAIIAKGYSAKTAAQYVNGDIDLETLSNAPKAEVKETPTDTSQNTKHDESCGHHLNALEDESTGIVNTQQSSLQNAMINVEARMVGNVINRIDKIVAAKNDITSENFTYQDVMTKRDQKEFEKEINMILEGFYAAIFLYYANQVLNKRANEFGMQATFSMDKEVRAVIQQNASKVAQSHVDTVLKDIYKAAYDKALTGASQQEIISELTNKFSSEISKVRAQTIARTETNRAFTMSQFEADIQFIQQNNLEGRVYKQWMTRSGNPCSFCLQLVNKGPIPFNENFADLGDVLTTSETVEDGRQLVKTYPVKFEAPKAGNLHPNCGCTYTLTIR